MTPRVRESERRRIPVYKSIRYRRFFIDEGKQIAQPARWDVTETWLWWVFPDLILVGGVRNIDDHIHLITGIGGKA